MTATRSVPVGVAAGDADRRQGLRLTGLLALLTLVFVPTWIDFEPARRGVLMSIVGIGLLGFAVRRGAGLALARTGMAPLVALVVWLFASVPFAAAPTDQALQRVLYLAGLGVLYFVGARSGHDAILHAVIPVGVLVSAYGTAQALGLDVPSGFARPDQPVSTLGNTNAASEVATFALAAAMALAVRGGRRARAYAAAAIAIGIYVGLNGTRAGYVGVILASALVALSHRPPAIRLAVIAAAAASTLLGYVLRPSAASAETPATPTAATAVASPSTIDVRLALWSGTLDLVADAPLTGHGAGSFRFEYPRFRTEAEIEATSFGRRFATFAENPHNELLEFAVEGGLPAVLLVLWLAWAVARAGLRGGRGAIADFAPLAAFAFACTVRAPLQNAPVAAAAAMLAGALAQAGAAAVPRAATRPAWVRGLALLLGASLLVGGAAAVIAATLATHVGDTTRLETAARLQPGESRYRSLLVQARCGGVDAAGLLVDHGPTALAACRADLAALLDADPNNTNALFLAAQLGLGGGDRNLARAALGRILELDRSEPRAQSLTAVLLAREGDVPAAIATLYARPHASLRAKLSVVLSELTGLPGLSQEALGLLRREIRFVDAADALLADPGSGTAAQAILAVAGSNDPRGPVLVAVRLRALGQSDEADALAPQATGLAAGDAGSLRLLGPLLDPLRGLPRWREILPPGE